MHARVVTSQSQSGRQDEALAIVRDSIIPAAKQQKGFKSYLGLTNRETGKNITITLWETEDDMIAGETGGYYQEQIAKVAPLLAGPPTTEHYEVSVEV